MTQTNTRNRPKGLIACEVSVGTLARAATEAVACERN